MYCVKHNTRLKHASYTHYNIGVRTDLHHVFARMLSVQIISKPVSNTIYVCYELASLQKHRIFQILLCIPRPRARASCLATIT